MPVTNQTRTAQARSAKSRASLNKSVSPVVLAVAIVVVVAALGAGLFYVINGGWKTEGQKQWDFQHVDAPLAAARRGRPEMLEEENASRKASGQPLLRAEDRHQRAGNVKQKLLEIQSRMNGAQGSPGQ